MTFDPRPVQNITTTCRICHLQQTYTSTEFNILILHHLACLKLKRIFQVRNDLQTTHNALQDITNKVNDYSFPANLH